MSGIAYLSEVLIEGQEAGEGREDEQSEEGKHEGRGGGVKSWFKQKYNKSRLVTEVNGREN